MILMLTPCLHLVIVSNALIMLHLYNSLHCFREGLVDKPKVGEESRSQSKAGEPAISSQMLQHNIRNL